MHPFDYLKLNNGITLVLTPCPGTKNTGITEALQTLRDAGVTSIITVLSNDELNALSVGSLGKEIAANHIAWFQLPIEDDCEPAEAFTKAWVESKQALLSLLQKKEFIAIHCRGGSGRTGLMAAILLLEAGEPWEDVKSAIHDIRPKALTLPVHLSYLKKHYSI